MAQTASHEDTWSTRGVSGYSIAIESWKIGMTRDGQLYDPLAGPTSTQRR